MTKQITSLAELALAGAILQRPEKAIEICNFEGISSASFSDTYCARIHSAAHSFVSSGKPCEMVSILTSAGVDGEVEKTQKAIDACTSFEFAEHFAREIKRAEKARSLLVSMSEAAKCLKSGGSLDSAILQLSIAIEAAEYTRRGNKIECALQFYERNEETPPEVIRGIIRAGQVGMMAASSKAGKSWAMLDLAFAVATGGKWLGWDTTQGRVLYINAELPTYDLRSRLHVLAGSKGVDVPDGIDIWHMRGQNKTVIDLIPAILTRQKETGQPYRLIIPDPLYCFGGGRDENDNAEQAKTMGELSALAEKTGAAVWVAHHFSKGNKRDTDHLDRASGAGMYARAVDTFMTFTRHDEEHAYAVETTCRSFSRPEKVAVRWEYPLWTIAPDLDPDDLKKPNTGGRKSKYSKEGVADAIRRVGPVSWAVAFEAYHQDTGISQRHFGNILQLALQSNLVQKVGEIYRAK